MEPYDGVGVREGTPNLPTSGRLTNNVTNRDPPRFDAGGITFAPSNRSPGRRLHGFSRTSVSQSVGVQFTAIRLHSLPCYHRKSMYEVPWVCR